MNAKKLILTGLFGLVLTLQQLKADFVVVYTQPVVTVPVYVSQPVYISKPVYVQQPIVTVTVPIFSRGCVYRPVFYHSRHCR